jgi:hypothetical protein
VAQSGAEAGGVRRYLLVVGLVFLALVMALTPDVGFTAPPTGRLLFWTLQIGVGLLVLQSVLHGITRLLGATRVPSWTLVVLTGLLGSILLAPAYWAIGEGLMVRWLGYPALPDDNGAGLDRLSVGAGILAEFGEIVGPVTTAWVLICLPRLHWMVAPLLQGPPLKPAATERATAADRARAQTDPAPGDRLPARGVDPVERGSAGPVPVIDAPVIDAPTSVGVDPPWRAGWRERLPTEIGRDVIVVASELQYLRVWTPRGCALILGALAEVEAEDAPHGVRVHRSWWVATRHVRSVRRTAGGAVCLMSNGRRVPVSRRRRAEVLARFGDGARYLVPVASEPVPHPELHRQRVVAR